MVEQGFVQFVQAGLNNSTVLGGWPVMIPAKSTINSANPQAWTYRTILSKPLYTLQGQDGLTKWQVQIDCHGYTMADAITLARSIDNLLRGSWSGTFADPDNTQVLGIFRTPLMVDGYDDANKTFVRSIEYAIHYYQI